MFFITPIPALKKLCLGGGYKNDVTEMIHLLTFQSIKNVLYLFLNLEGSIEIFLYPHPYAKKIVWWGYKKNLNDETEMILSNQSKMNSHSLMCR